MIEAQTYLTIDNITSFSCPICKAAETTYGGMPNVCWRCGHLHKADPDVLMAAQRDRLFYYKHGKTPVNATKERRNVEG